MKTYISSAWEIYQKWALFLAGLFWWVFVILGIKDFIATGNSADIIGIVIILLQIFSFLYIANKPTIVFIEGRNIVIKSIFKELRFDINSYKEVTQNRWSRRYSIHFNNGQHFLFYPKLSGNFYYDVRSKVEAINTSITEAKDNIITSPQ